MDPFIRKHILSLGIVILVLSEVATTPQSGSSSESDGKPVHIKKGHVAGLEDQCKYHGDGHLYEKDKCSKYFICTKGQNDEWVLIDKKCKFPGSVFDEVLQICVELFGYCANTPCNYTGIEKCKRPNTFYVDTTIDCRHYFRCHLHVNDLWFPEHLQCDSTQFFNESSGQCESGYCPDELEEVPKDSGWDCKENNQTIGNTKQCNKYLQCIACSKPSGWCYKEIHECPNGHVYNDVAKKCAKTEVCPHLWKPLKPGEENCTLESQYKINETDCKKYLLCHQCDAPGGWCYEPFSCPEGEYYFDEVTGTCHEARACLAGTQPVPEDSLINCSRVGQGRKRVGYCHNFHVCHHCGKSATGWCANTYICMGEDALYNAEIDGCQFLDVCPQWKQVEAGDPQKRNCKADNSIQVEKKDCHKYYICHKCKLPGGWCYEPVTCPNGLWFNEAKAECIRSDKCPQ